MLSLADGQNPTPPASASVRMAAVEAAELASTIGCPPAAFASRVCMTPASSAEPSSSGQDDLPLLVLSTSVAITRASWRAEGRIAPQGTPAGRLAQSGGAPSVVRRLHAA